MSRILTGRRIDTARPPDRIGGRRAFETRALPAVGRGLGVRGGGGTVGVSCLWCTALRSGCGSRLRGGVVGAAGVVVLLLRVPAHRAASVALGAGDGGGGGWR
eukprot:ctg_786.g156